MKGHPPLRAAGAGVCVIHGDLWDNDLFRLAAGQTKEVVPL